eukprot:m51a1_g13209 hypothetical protein (385) ;mRNA; r:113-2409
MSSKLAARDIDTSDPVLGRAPIREDLVRVRADYLSRVSASRGADPDLLRENLDPLLGLQPSTTADVLVFELPDELLSQVASGQISPLSIASSPPRVGSPCATIGFHSQSQMTAGEQKSMYGETLDFVPRNTTLLSRGRSVSVGKVVAVGGIIDVVNTMGHLSSGSGLLDENLSLVGVCFGAFCDESPDETERAARAEDAATVSSSSSASTPACAMARVPLGVVLSGLVLVSLLLPVVVSDVLLSMSSNRLILGRVDSEVANTAASLSSVVENQLAVTERLAITLGTQLASNFTDWRDEVAVLRTELQLIDGFGPLICDSYLNRGPKIVGVARAAQGGVVGWQTDDSNVTCQSVLNDSNPGQLAWTGVVQCPSTRAGRASTPRTS